MRMRKVMTVAGLAFASALLLAPAALAQEDPTEESGSEGGEADFRSHAEEECAHLLEEGGAIDDCQEAPSPLLPELNEIIWGGIAFLVVAFVLGKFAWPALQKGMATREEKIRGDLEAAEAERVEAESRRAEYERSLADARTEAGRIIEEARQTADDVRRDLVARAESDAAEIRTRAQEDITLATERATADLRDRVAELSIELAEKVVERNLDPDTQRALIDSYISEVGSN